MKQTVVLGFDGVVHQYRPGGWQGPTVIVNPPVPGIREAIEELSRDYTVVIQSSRCAHAGGVDAILCWLSRWGIDGVSRVLAEKPPAVCYVDDKALTFDGDPASLPEKVRAFQPWQERNRSEEGPDGKGDSFHGGNGTNA